MRSCQKCWAPLSDPGDFCPRCGARITPLPHGGGDVRVGIGAIAAAEAGGASAGDHAPARRDRARVLALGVIIGLLAALCGVSLWAAFSQPHRAPLAWMPPMTTLARNGWSWSPSPESASTSATPSDAAFVLPRQAGEAAVAAALVASGPATIGMPAVSASRASRTHVGLITVETFGFSYGPPPGGCRFVADVRNIHAGSFTGTGLWPSVQRQVMATRAAKTWEHVFVTRWIPALRGGDKVAIGCAIGHHRSVAMSVVLSRHLKALGFKVRLVHRDLWRPA